LLLGAFSENDRIAFKFDSSCFLLSDITVIDRKSTPQSFKFIDLLLMK